MAKQGRFIWHELMAESMEDAQSFYTEVVGWKTKPWEGPMPYTAWMVDDVPVGGLMTLPEDAKKMGAPPQWMGYVRVEDVEQASAKVKALGGQIHKSKTSIPGVGTFAVAADPQGAVFSLFTPESEMPAPDREKIGHFSWVELNTTDYEGAWKFYSELLGWKHTSSMDMGPGGTYFMFQSEDELSKGGMSNAATQMKAPPHWLYYVTVDDADAAAERIKQNGGKVMNGPMDVPGDDRVAQCMDPQGAAFAIYSKGKKK